MLEQNLHSATEALQLAAKLPVAPLSLFEFRALDRLRFYAFVHFYLANPRLTLLYVYFMYAPADLAGFPGLRDLTLWEACLLPQIAAMRLMRAFGEKSPILSTVGVYSLLASLFIEVATTISWSLRGTVRRKRRTVLGMIATTARKLAIALGWRLLWPVLPWWLCDLVR